MVTSLLALFAREGRTRRSPLVLVLGLLLIFSWQRTVSDRANPIDDSWRITASQGVHFEVRFFFFLRHLGIYPLSTMQTPRADTRAEAERIIREAPRDLYVDRGLTFRSGDRGRVYLYWADKWLRPTAHDSRNPKLWPAGSAGFIVGLCGVWAGLWWLRRPILGALLVALLGSNPFQIYAAHYQENVFGWPINTMLLLLALNLPLFDGATRRSKLPWVIAIGSGLLLATLRTVRSEPAALVSSIAVVYLLARGQSVWRRAALVVALVATFVGAGRLYARHFVAQVEAVNHFISARGGVPYLGPVEPYHEFWHPVWCGLGDFDTKYQYQWDDLAAYRSVVRSMRSRPDQHPALDETRWAQPIYYDREQYYEMYFSEAPGFHELIRRKVLADIERDPKWYVEILKKRLEYALEHTTPVTFRLDGKQSWRMDSSLWGLFWIGCALYFFARGDRFALALLLFSVPLSATSLIVYSGGGLTYYACAHLFAAALAVHEALRRLAQSMLAA